VCPQVRASSRFPVSIKPGNKSLLATWNRNPLHHYFAAEPAQQADAVVALGMRVPWNLPLPRKSVADSPCPADGYVSHDELPVAPYEQLMQRS
jgi:hypothetical protein